MQLYLSLGWLHVVWNRSIKMRNLEVKYGTNKHFQLKKRISHLKIYITMLERRRRRRRRIRTRRRQQLTEQGYMHLMEMISLLKHTEKLPLEQSQQHLRHSFPTWYLYNCNYTSPQYIFFGQNITWVGTLFLLCLQSSLQWQEMMLHLAMVHCGNVGFSYQYLCRLPQKQNHPPVSHCCPLLVHAHQLGLWRTDINWWNYSNIFVCWREGLRSFDSWSSGSEHQNVHSDGIIQQDIVLHKEDIRFQP